MLSTGAKIGIFLAAIVVVAGTTTGIYFGLTRKKSTGKKGTKSDSQSQKDVSKPQSQPKTDVTKPDSQTNIDGHDSSSSRTTGRPTPTPISEIGRPTPTPISEKPDDHSGAVAPGGYKVCEMSDWSAWGDCTKPCGGGNQTRSRTIVKKYDPNEVCPSNTQTQVCNTEQCPQDCEMSDWSAWGDCTKSCGGGTQTRTRTVLKQPVGKGKACGELTDTQNCNTNACSKNCVLGQWSDWGDCSVSCGGGTQTSTREIIKPAEGQGTCQQGLTMTRYCNKQACAPAKPVSKDCTLGEWGDWSPCNVTCGGGQQSRSRSVIQPAVGEGKCGPVSQIQKCNTNVCDVDCKLGAWEEWSDCSKKCGGGSQTRSRPVLVAQQGNGTCGSTTQSRDCNTQSCPWDVTKGAPDGMGYMTTTPMKLLANSFRANTPYGSKLAFDTSVTSIPERGKNCMQVCKNVPNANLSSVVTSGGADDICGCYQVTDPSSCIKWNPGYTAGSTYMTPELKACS